MSEHEPGRPPEIDGAEPQHQELHLVKPGAGIVPVPIEDEAEVETEATADNVELMLTGPARPIQDEPWFAELSAEDKRWMLKYDKGIVASSEKLVRSHYEMGEILSGMYTILQAAKPHLRARGSAWTIIRERYGVSRVTGHRRIREYNAIRSATKPEVYAVLTRLGVAEQLTTEQLRQLPETTDVAELQQAVAAIQAENPKTHSVTLAHDKQVVVREIAGFARSRLRRKVIDASPAHLARLAAAVILFEAGLHETQHITPREAPDGPKRGRPKGSTKKKPGHA